MAIKSERIPELNPLRFIKYGDALAANINTWSPGRGFFWQHRRQWEYGDVYQLKRNYSDTIDIYLDTLATALYIRLYDEEGTEIATTLSGIGITGISVAGNTYTYGGIDYPYQSIFQSYAFSTLFPGFAEDQQIFYFALELDYGGGEGDAGNRWYVSEPVFVRKNGWPRTMLVEATQTGNDYDVLFEQTNASFRYRVEAKISDEAQPAFSDTVFTDQLYEQRKLQSSPYNLYDFLVGGFGGVPKYMLTKINRAISCDSFSIDGVPYAKDNGAAWSMTSVTDYNLYGGKIRLQEASHDQGTEYGHTEDAERFHDDYHDIFHD